MNMKNKNRSHRYDINRPRSRHGHKYSKYKKMSLHEDDYMHHRDGSRTAATSKMERFVIIVNGFKPLTIITKRSILDVAAVLDPPEHQATPKQHLKFNS